MKNVGLIIQILIIFISSLLFGRLNLVKLETKDLYTTLVPLFAVIISSFVIRSKNLVSFFTKLKHFISNEPIKWEVRGVFESNEDLSNYFVKFYKDISKNLKKSYTSVKCDFQSGQRILLNVDCVRIELLNTFSVFDKKYILDITFSSESPVKTFNRKHLEKMINPTFNHISKTLIGIKFEASANKQFIPFERLNEFESTMEVINYCVDLKTRNKKSLLSISKDFGFNCVSSNWNECLYYINKYILG